MDVMDVVESLDGNGGDADVETGADLREGSIGIIRDLVLKANPDLVPEMVRGETLTELMTSVEPARAAYQRIVEAVRSRGRTTAPVVPAGGAVSPVAIDDLTADGLIKRGLAQSRGSGTKG